MTRRLPWLKDTRPLVVRSSQPLSPSTPRQKRRRILEADPDIDQGSGDELDGRKSLNNQSSPPPAFVSLSERMMEEGLDKDDRYRMVEDEFLDAAKQFTQHLHAAEYRRLKKAAKSQNAATINSISRPVTVKMPDETRRKVASMTKARKHATALQCILGKQSHNSGSEEEADDHGNVWVGTALHGLMEAPRKAAPSLTSIAEITATTHATIGFHKPQWQKSTSHSLSPSVPLNRYIISGENTIRSTEAANDVSDDDDLDSAIRPRKVLKYTSAEKAEAFTAKSINLDLLRSSVEAEDSYPIESDENLPSRGSTNVRQRIAKRLEQSKLREIKKHQEARKRLEIIPTFLS